MALTDLQRVRLAISDKPKITREITVGDGDSKFFKLQNECVQSSPALQVHKNGSMLTEGVDYSVTLDQGLVVLSATPTAGDSLTFTYYYTVFTDDEINQFMTDAGGNLTLAAAYALMAWAADASKVARRMTMSGGGGLGQTVQDTSVAAKELRQTAKDLIELQKNLGEDTPADGITEVVWNELSYERGLEQDWLRNS
jgi:hypothetical protein